MMRGWTALYNFDQRRTTRAGRRFDADDGGQGRRDVNGLDFPVNAPCGQAAAGEDDRYVGIVTRRRAVGHRRRQTVGFRQKRVGLEYDEDIAGTLRAVVAQDRID